ncbi:MAG TPA: DNA polymerase III subunit gamma/tau [Clostridiales bacterium]|nr:DNA polymerase III subunit gamma/tau [Clostridiales bacterium]
MAYKSLYRVYRPAVFGDVYGQRHITDILKKQVEADKPSHAYLFCGPRGTGKTSTAKIFAQALNCLHPKDGDPCRQCEVCGEVEKDAFVDIVEIDAASNNGVDNVRDIREKVSLLPAQGKYKVYIIDEVHMLSAGAFNALLKTLEEPPPHAVFILATTELRKVPATILSRCQRYDFKRITEADIVARLAFVAQEQGVEYEEEALKLIAAQAEGAMRDALSIMDQCISGGGALTKEAVFKAVGIADAEETGQLAQAVLEENPGQALSLLKHMLAEGVSPNNILRDTIVALSEELTKNARDPYKCANTLRSLEALIGAQTNMRYAGVPNAVLCAAIVRAACNTTDMDTEDVELRLKKLEMRVDKLARGNVAPSRDGGHKPLVEKQRETQEAALAREEPRVEARHSGQAKQPLEQPGVRQPQGERKEGGEPSVQAGEGAFSSEELDAALKKLKDGILHRNMVLYPAVDAVKALSVRGGRLVLHVEEADELMAHMLANETSADDVRPVVSEVFGREMAIAFARAESVPQGKETGAVSEVAEELIGVFGAENVEIK